MKGRGMNSGYTIDGILYLMESDQPIQIIWVDPQDFHEEVMYEGRLRDMPDSNVWDTWEPAKILTPDDNDGTIRFVC
jgi:hypothetical protein